MKTVRIISGTYGYRDKKGRLAPKNRNDGAFELADDEAARIIGLGIAEPADKEVATPFGAGFAGEPGNSLSEGNDASNNESEPIMHPDYNADTSVTELREIAKNIGMVFKVGMTKEEMISELDDYFDAQSPDLSAASPIG